MSCSKCMHCQRTFGSPHPLSELASKGRMVKRRSERSKDCSTCAPRFLGEVYPAETATPEARQQFAQKLWEDPAKLEDFRAHQQKWMRNTLYKRGDTNGDPSSNRSKGGDTTDDVDIEDP